MVTPAPPLLNIGSERKFCLESVVRNSNFRPLQRKYSRRELSADFMRAISAGRLDFGSEITT